MNIPADFLPDELITSLPLLGLYAESHFRFRIPFSRYFKREPELIFDTPWRLEPGQTLTVFLIIKDAHRFPVKLRQVVITIRHDQQDLGSQTWELDQTVSDQQIELEFEFNNGTLPAGELEITPVLHYSIHGKERQMTVDNYALLAKPPLRVTHSQEKLPNLPGWLSGDTHLHSSLTNDQVEFGASLEVSRKAAQLMGMHFITATDHSYDLDDDPEDYLKNDPELAKWKSSRQSLAKMNAAHELTIVPGEEISVANNRGANVHLLHFNDPQYFPGSGDGGENWTNFHSQLGIADVLEQRSPGTVSVGAHTAYQFSWLTRMLLNRGHWERADHELNGLDGVQIICGTPATTAFQDSRQAWIRALLNGYKLGVYGGSDGHGNFNRNWHVKLPVWSLGIHEDQIFGQSRTLLKSGGGELADLMEAMRTRRTALSTGPVGEIVVKAGGKQAGIGDTLAVAVGEQLTITLRGQSSAEFGTDMDVTLYGGRIKADEEVILYHGNDHHTDFEFHLPFPVETNGYLRLEISSEGSRWPGVFVSSPIWIEFS